MFAHLRNTYTAQTLSGSKLPGCPDAVPTASESEVAGHAEIWARTPTETCRSGRSRLGLEGSAHRLKPLMMQRRALCAQPQPLPVFDQLSRENG